MSVCIVMSVRPSAPTEQTFMKFDIWIFFVSPSKTFRLHWNMPIIAALCVQTDRCTVLITSRSVLLRMRIVSGNSRRENQNTHFYGGQHLQKSCRLWGNVEKCGRDRQTDRPQMTIWRMRIACRIARATNTHSQYVIPIALPLQQWLHKRASMLCYSYIAGPVISIIMIHKVMLLTY